MKCWRPRAWWVPFGLALAAGCQSSSVEPEKLGTPLTPGDEGITVALWSADGSEIDYIAASNTMTSIKAARSDASGVRVIDETKPEYWSLLGPPDGSSLYYTAVETPPDKGPTLRSLYEAFHMQRLDAIALDQKADVLAASPDDHHIAVWSANTVHEVDLADGSSTDLAVGLPPLQQTAGNSWVLTYSPAGDKLFFLTGSPVSLSGTIIDLASKQIDPHSLAMGNFPLPSWSAQGLRALSVAVSDMRTLQIEDVVAGEVHPLAWQPPHSFGGASWSHDGARIAAVDSWCTSGDVLN